MYMPESLFDGDPNAALDGEGSAGRLGLPWSLLWRAHRFTS